MITIMQGASKTLSILLKSDQLVVLDPDMAYNIELELYHESKGKRLALYGTNGTYMDTLAVPYTLAEINSEDHKIYFYVDEATTATFPLGRIVGRFTIRYGDSNFESNFRVIKARGVIFNVIQ